MKVFSKVVALGLLLFTIAANAQFWKQQNNALLKDHEAFIESVYIDQQTLHVIWQIADDYYMYRDQFDVVAMTPGVTFGQAAYPQGVIEDDPEFGEVSVYFNRVEYTVPLRTWPENISNIELELKGQGCNKPIGVCYAPQTRSVSLQFDADAAANSKSSNAPISAPNNSSNEPSPSSFWSYLATAFGAGVLLSFTACVLPMIPILAGIIAGQQNPSKLQSGWLAICYVAGTMITYAIIGWVAGASGTQVQAYFQHPWFIVFICLILVSLALSLFGVFKIQLPSTLQTKLNSTNVSSRSASVSSFSLGLISSLVVGACVSPVLILILGVAIKNGDPVLGAAIMSTVALGMGSLLILFGFGAGWLLPRAGAWMEHIQVLFGFMVLGVAIYIASALPIVPNLYLWAALLLWAGSYLLRFTSALRADLTASFLKAIGFGLMLWGGLALIGASTGGNDILKPLSSLQLSSNNTNKAAKLPFTTVTTQQQALALLEQARNDGTPALIDFYADWCVECKRMDKTTFLQPSVHQALAGWTLIKIDVTDTTTQSEQVKRMFEVFGPPATLFYNKDGNEASDLRQYGYLKEAQLLSLIEQVAG